MQNSSKASKRPPLGSLGHQNISLMVMFLLEVRFKLYNKAAEQSKLSFDLTSAIS